MKTLIIIIVLLANHAIASEIYRGFYTSHNFISDHNLNENNELLVIKHRGFFVGSMTNSYNRPATIVGVDRSVDIGRFEFTAGLALSTGYKKSDFLIDLPFVFGMAPMPVLTVSYAINEVISIKYVNTVIVNNVGLSFKF